MAFTFNARVWEGLKGFLDRDCRLIILSLVVNVVLGISKSLASFATAVPLNETMSYFFDNKLIIEKVTHYSTKTTSIKRTSKTCVTIRLTSIFDGVHMAQRLVA